MRRGWPAALACALLLAACGDAETNAPPVATPLPGSNIDVKAQATRLCKSAVQELSRLPRASFNYDPYNPGRKLKAIGRYLDRIDPNDRIERKLANDLRALGERAHDQTLASLIQTIEEIAQRESARNDAAIAGNLRRYLAENTPIDTAYTQLRQTASFLSLPACTLGY